jgi:hypothetical protein
MLPYWMGKPVEEMTKEELIEVMNDRMRREAEQTLLRLEFSPMLSARLASVLWWGGCRERFSVEMFVSARTPEQLLRLPNFGRACLRELERHGLTQDIILAEHRRLIGVTPERPSTP